MYLVDKSTCFVLFTLCLNNGCFCGMLLSLLTKGCSLYVISPMDLSPIPHNYEQSLVLYIYNHKTTSIDQFATTHLVNMRSLIRNKMMTPWDPNFFQKSAIFVVPYFHQFVKDSYETSNIH